VLPRLASTVLLHKRTHLGVMSTDKGRACNTYIANKDDGAAIRDVAGELDLRSLIENVCVQCDTSKTSLFQLFLVWTQVRDSLIDQCKTQPLLDAQASCLQGFETIDGIMASAKDIITNTDICTTTLGCPAQSPPAPFVDNPMPPPSVPGVRGGEWQYPLEGMCTTCGFMSSMLADQVALQRTTTMSSGCVGIALTPEECDVERKQFFDYHTAAESTLRSSKLCFMCRDAPVDNFAVITMMELGNKNRPGGICDTCEAHYDGKKTEVREWIEVYQRWNKKAARSCKQLGESKTRAMCSKGVAQVDALMEQIGTVMAESDVCSLIGCESKLVGGPGIAIE
jgi:hypothetical protein